MQQISAFKKVVQGVGLRFCPVNDATPLNDRF
jgi:hypothetical protein